MSIMKNLHQDLTDAGIDPAAWEEAYSGESELGDFLLAVDVLLATTEGVEALPFEARNVVRTAAERWPLNS